MIDPTENAAVVPTACPDCGDAVHPCETTCASCGTHLTPSNTTAPAREPLDVDSVQGQKEPIMAATTDGGPGVLAALHELDGLDPEARLMVTALDATHAALARKPASLRSVRVQDSEPTDDEAIWRGPYEMDGRGENDRSL